MGPLAVQAFRAGTRCDRAVVLRLLAHYAAQVMNWPCAAAIPESIVSPACCAFALWWFPLWHQLFWSRG